MFPLYRKYLQLVKKVEDTKEDSESCKSRYGQYSGQKKKQKQKQKTNNDLQNTTQKTKIEQHEPTKNDVCTQVLMISKSGSTCGIRRVAPVTNR